MLLLLTALAQAAPRPCATLERMVVDGYDPRPAPPLPFGPPAAEKAERDAFGIAGNTLRTDNFIARWGDEGRVTEAEVTRLLAAFEDAWAEEIGVQGHPLPIGAGTYRFNIYIGDSGGGTPESYGAAGYFNTDGEGQPMVVVAAGTLDDPEYADITAAHEFYHAIQGATNRFSYTGDSAWYWEATATWASATVYPDNLYYATFLFSYALLPHYPVNFFDYPDSGALQEYFQYGAFFFPFDLTEVVADRALIQETWTDTGTIDDPVAVLTEKLADRGIDFNEAWLDSIARLTVFDYPLGDQYEDIAHIYDGYYPDEAGAALLGPVRETGTDGPQAIDEDLRPYRYGHNAVAIRPQGTPITLTVTGDSVGTKGSPATWGGRLIRDLDGAYTTLPLTFTDGVATLALDDLGPTEELYLVVGPWTASSRYFDREQFGWTYDVAVPPPPADTAADTSDPGPIAEGADDGKSTAGCACAAAASPHTASALLLGLGLLAARRRRS